MEGEKQRRLDYNNYSSGICRRASLVVVVVLTAKGWTGLVAVAAALEETRPAMRIALLRYTSQCLSAIRRVFVVFVFVVGAADNRVSYISRSKIIFPQKTARNVCCVIAIRARRCK